MFFWLGASRCTGVCTQQRMLGDNDKDCMAEYMPNMAPTMLFLQANDGSQRNPGVEQPALQNPTPTSTLRSSPTTQMETAW